MSLSQKGAGWLRARPLALQVAGSMLAALAMYWLGVSFVLPVVVVVLGALFLPMPTIFASRLSRMVVSVVATIALLQIAALLQFFVAPQSDFTITATLFAALALGALLYLARKPRPSKIAIVGRHDVYAGVIAIIFLLPFVPLVLGNSSYGITQVGGLQSPDAGHHFDFIAIMAEQQHLDTTGYPKSFHLSLAFLQTAFLPGPANLSWQANAIVFFSHYLVLGALTAYTLYYLCAFWVQKLAGQVVERQVWPNLALAVGLGIAVCLLALWPFVALGFLNYYFVVVAFALVTMYFFEAYTRRPTTLLDGSLLVGGLFAVAVSATWPLLLPALLGSLALVLIRLKTNLRQLWQMVIRPTSIPLLALVVLACVPLLLQVIYPGTTGLNAVGALRTYHSLLVVGGLVLLVYLIMRSKIGPGLLSVFAPLVLLSVALVVFQLLTTGEVRYFAIKVSLLLEILLLVLAVAALANGKRQPSWNWLLLIVPVGVVALLLSAANDPFKDVRDLFRDYLGQSKPAFYNQDALAVAGLGVAGKIDHFNATVLHYDHQRGQLVGHTLLPQWAQTIKYQKTADLPTKRCHRLIYHNLVYGSASQGEQQALVEKVKECAKYARQNGHTYYIITDGSSLPFLQAALGKEVEYVRP